MKHSVVSHLCLEMQSWMVIASVELKAVLTGSRGNGIFLCRRSILSSCSVTDDGWSFVFLQFGFSYHGNVNVELLQAVLQLAILRL